jgi:polyhydroxyalkanoate synthesis regulator phasin
MNKKEKIAFLEDALAQLIEYKKNHPETPKEDPRHDSVYQRLEALERRQQHDFSTITELEKKVKALEDRQREQPWTKRDPDLIIYRNGWNETVPDPSKK